MVIYSLRILLSKPYTTFQYLGHLMHNSTKQYLFHMLEFIFWTAFLKILPPFLQVHKGRLENGTFVAIRSLALYRKYSIRNLRMRLDLLSKLRHPHLVGLLGHCIDGGMQDDSTLHRLFLVQEFVPNGNFRSHLSGTRIIKVVSFWGISFQNQNINAYFVDNGDYMFELILCLQMIWLFARWNRYLNFANLCKRRKILTLDNSFYQFYE